MAINGGENIFSLNKMLEVIGSFVPTGLAPL